MAGAEQGEIEQIEKAIWHSIEEGVARHLAEDSPRGQTIEQLQAKIAETMDAIRQGEQRERTAEEARQHWVARAAWLRKQSKDRLQIETEARGNAALNAMKVQGAKAVEVESEMEEDHDEPRKRKKAKNAKGKKNSRSIESADEEEASEGGSDNSDSDGEGTTQRREKKSKASETQMRRMWSEPDADWDDKVRLMEYASVDALELAINRLAAVKEEGLTHNLEEQNQPAWKEHTQRNLRNAKMIEVMGQKCYSMGGDEDLSTSKLRAGIKQLGKDIVQTTQTMALYEKLAAKTNWDTATRFRSELKGSPLPDTIHKLESRFIKTFKADRDANAAKTKTPKNQRGPKSQQQRNLSNKQFGGGDPDNAKPPISSRLGAGRGAGFSKDGRTKR